MKHVSSKHLWWLGPIIIVAFVIAAVVLMPWNVLKPVIIERIEEATGRSVAIHGDVGITLFPRPTLSLHEIEVANPEWAASPHMLEAQRLSVSPSLGALIQGQIVLGDIEIAGATLHLEQRDDAPGNWVLGDKQANRQAQADEDVTSPVDIHHLSVSESKVHYRAAEADTPLTLSISSLQMHADDQTLHTQGTLAFQGRRFELEAQTDPIGAFMNDARAFGGELSLGSGESLLTGTFEVPEAPAWKRLQAEGELSLHNLAEWSKWLEFPRVELASLEMAARLEREGSEWRLDNIDTTVVDSRVAGELSVDTAGAAPTLDGRLHASRLDIAALRAAWPESEEKKTGVSLPVLPDLRGEIALSVDRLTLEAALLHNVQAQVRLAEHSVMLDPLIFDIAGGKVETDASLTSSPERVAAQARIALQDLSLAELGMALDPGDTLDAELTLELQSLEQRPVFERNTLLASLRIDNSHFTYRNEKAGSNLEATLETTGEGTPPGLLLGVKGTFHDKPLEMRVRGAPLPRLVNLEDGALKQDYPIEAEATSKGVFTRVDTTLASILHPQTFEGEVVLEAEGREDLDAWIGPVLPPLPEFRLAGRLSRDNAQWSATGLDGEIGATRVAGSVEVLNTERPVVDVVLEAGRIDLARLISATTKASDDEAQDDSLLAPLRGFDGQLALSAKTLVLPSGLELRELVLVAELQAGRLQVEPLHFRLGDGSLAGSLALDATELPASGRLEVEFDDIALARLGDAFTPIEDRLGRVSGELHLEMSETLPNDRRDDLLWPFIGRLRVEPSTLRFHDPKADTDLTLSLETHGSAAGAQTFHMEGEGRYDGMPASLTLRGDPLLDVRDPHRPYALDLEASIVDTRLRLQGTLLRPLALEGLNLELALQGPNPQRLSRLLGVALPRLPSYSVSGNLDLGNQRWTFTDMEGEVGDSDLYGRLALDVSVRPPRLTGELTSTDLHIEDLGGLVGAPPEEAESEADERFILPDAPIIGDAWHGVSAEVSFRGQSVRAGDIPLSNVVIEFRLEEGRGRFDPVGFGVGEGRVDLVIDLDTGTQPPSGTLQVEVQGVDLNDALRNWELADGSVGILGGRGKLWIEGASVAELLASADGGMVLLMTGGRLEALLVEMAGLDAGETFVSWLRGRGPIPIDCAYADLQARDGVTQLDTFVVDTNDTTFTVGGQVDLNTERVDVSIIAHPKDPSVFVGRSPLHLGGTFSNIDIGVHPEGLVMRVGASAVLGAVAGPITALLPLVDVGTGPNMAYCQGLIRRSREAIEEGIDE